jgi:hypothetical protein
MKKIKSFDKFNRGISKLSIYINNIIKDGGRLASDLWNIVKVEKEETKISFEILNKMIKGEEVSENEKKFFRAHSIDLIRIIPLVAVSGIPIPIPITPLLIILSKKYGFNLLPRDNRELLKSQIELPDKIKSKLIELPESGMGYHNVDVILKSGDILKDRIVVNSSKLILNINEFLNVDDIEDVTVI